jgi:SEC-C motif-containing protein
VSYIKQTLVPEKRSTFDEENAKEWAQTSTWKGLQILSTEAGGETDKTGVVEFVATFEQNNKVVEHHEVSQFRKDGRGHWCFVDGEVKTNKPQTMVRSSPKIGRNDPCSCGSGKKYKKCCELTADA